VVSGHVSAIHVATTLVITDTSTAIATIPAATDVITVVAATVATAGSQAATIPAAAYASSAATIATTSATGTAAAIMRHKSDCAGIAERAFHVRCTRCLSGLPDEG
jgi:hypothetical protein